MQRMDLDQLTREFRALQQQVNQLQQELAELRASHGSAPASGSAATQLARRNASRLADEVRRRSELHPEPREDTDIDLLIDRLHDLALENGEP
ncbi:MAG: hypothetical protein ACO28R_04150 [Vulcanococcus sp.]